MSNKVKDINIIFNDIVNIKYFDPNNIKIDEKSYKNIFIYYIGYMMIKDLQCVKINDVKFFMPYFQESENKA